MVEIVEMEEKEKGPVSFFIAVYSYTKRYVSIIQLKTPEQQQEEDESMDDLTVVRFFPPKDDSLLIRWYVPPTTSSTDDLYIFPTSSSPPFHSYKFNFMTASFRKIKPPLSGKEDGFVLNVGHHTYFICGLNTKNIWDDTYIGFECYNADQDKWEALKSIPECPVWSRIVATAAWGDTLLFNVDKSGIRAYNVAMNKWYHVHVDDDRCCRILGKAVVLQDTTTTTIYALTDSKVFSFDTVLALSIKIEESSNGGDLVYKCSLHAEILVHVMDPDYDDDATVSMLDTNLVHLGTHNFCLVDISMVRALKDRGGFEVYLYIQLTYMELTGDKFAIVMTRHHKLKNQDWEHFDVVQCFFLPQCKATALGGGKRLDFQLDPHELQSVYVRNLPFYDSTVELVEKGLNKFGPIVRDGIQVQRKKKKCFAFVEFESAASKQDAIKAESVLIGDCWAEIYPKTCKRKRKRSRNRKNINRNRKMEMATEMNQPHSRYPVEHFIFYIIILYIRSETSSCL